MYKTEEYIEPIELRIRSLYMVMLLFVFATYIAFAIHTVDILVIRFLRIPLLVLLIFYAFRHAGDYVFRAGKNMKFLKLFFGVFLFYMLFNAIAGLNFISSVTYLLWFIGAFLFFFNILRLSEEGISASRILYTIASGFFWPGMFFIVESLIGGYVLNLPSYFDEGPNFETGGVVKEFGGIFGNANSLAMVTFVTFSSLLIVYTYSVASGKKSVLYLITLFFLLGLQVHIGSRTGIFCTYITALLYILFYKRSVYYVVSLLLPAVLYLMLNFGLVEEVFQVKQFQENKFGNRTELVDDAFRIADLMDFFGVGYANQRTSRAYFAVTEEFKEQGELHFHNTYLALWVELGYLGVVLFLFPIFFILWKAVFFIFSRRKRFTEQVRLLLITAFPTALFGLAEDSINMAGSPVFSFFWLYFFLVVFLMDNSYEIDEKDSLF